MVPKVTMNGGSFSRVIKSPFNNPEPVPTSVPTSVPATMPELVRLSPQTRSIVQAPAMPERASIEPTERSMPPEMMMPVMPTAMIVLTLQRRKTLRRLSAVKNVSGRLIERTMKINSRLAKGNNRRMSLLIVKSFHRRQVHHLVRAGLLRGEIAGQSTAAHDEDAVGHAE